MIDFKTGVIVTRVHPMIFNQIAYLATLWHDLFPPFEAPPFTVTSISDGEHMNGSKHYEGLAFDFRTRSITPEKARAFAADLQKRLQPAWDVVYETDHIHVEYDPKPVHHNDNDQSSLFA